MRMRAPGTGMASLAITVRYRAACGSGKTRFR